MLLIDNLTCGYQPNQPILEHVSLHLAVGEIGAILGPSGCGKTTLLKVIAGFQPVMGGRIVVQSRTVSQKKLTVPPEKRQIGVVFQDYALFPHLTVRENIAFGLKAMPPEEREKRITELLALTRLDVLHRAFPQELSGGQQQRVALARALAPQPSLILLDEPFSNLDAEMRHELAYEVKRILRAQGVSALMVTHDQQEAFSMASRIGLLGNGKLQQWDSPYQLYHEPANRFVASFIGRGVFIRGEMLSPTAASTAIGVIEGTHPTPYTRGQHVDVLLRPDDIAFDPCSEIQVTVLDRTFTGPTMHYRLQLRDGSQIETIAPSHDNFEPGTTVGIRLTADHLIAFEDHLGAP